MKFEFLYPNAKLYDATPNGDVMFMSHKGECGVCDERTNWAEINYHTYICSEECLNRIDNDFERAYNQPHCEHLNSNEFINQPYYCMCGHSGSQDFNVEYFKSFYDGLILIHRYKVIGHRYCGKCNNEISQLEIYCVKNQEEYYVKKTFRYLNLS